MARAAALSRLLLATNLAAFAGACTWLGATIHADSEFVRQHVPKLVFAAVWASVYWLTASASHRGSLPTRAAWLSVLAAGTSLGVLWGGWLLLEADRQSSPGAHPAGDVGGLFLYLMMSAWGAATMFIGLLAGFGGLLLRRSVARRSASTASKQ